MENAETIRGLNGQFVVVDWNNIVGFHGKNRYRRAKYQEFVKNPKNRVRQFFSVAHFALKLLNLH